MAGQRRPAETGTVAGASLILACVVLAGCTSHGPVGASLTLDRLEGTPTHFVEITEEDRSRYAVLDQLLSRWEAANGTSLGGFNEPHPYEESRALIRELQEREPDRQWPSYRVTVAHQGAYFDLHASQSYRA